LTFLYTAFLPALAGAAIPLLLHFLSRQRLPLIPFSSIEFLQRLQKRQTRRVQLRQIILLILRTLAIAALVMAFARPALKGAFLGGSGNAGTEMVILLDNGISSSAQSVDGSLLHVATQKAAKLLEAASTGDRVTMISGGEPESTPVTTVEGSELVGTSLKELEPRLVVNRVSDLLAHADTIFSSSRLFNRELYIVSDFYGSDWDSLIYSKSENARVFLLPVGPDKMANVGIEKVRLLSAIRRMGTPAELEVTFHNYDSRAVSGLMYGVYLDGERVSQGSLDLPAGGDASVKLSILASSSGMHSGVVKIEDPDPLAADNRRYFVFDIPETIRLLCVAPEDGSLEMLKAVFTAGKEGAYTAVFVSPGKWEAEPLDQTDVVMFADVVSISSGAEQRLLDLLNRGGGLIVMPGPTTDLAALSRGLFSSLGLKGIKGANSTGNGWGRFDRAHPIFSGVFEPNANPVPPRLGFTVELGVGEGDQTVIPLNSGSPFLLERGYRKSRVLVFASPPSDEEGDFIRSGIFAPLMYRAVAYALTGEEGFNDGWEVGTSPRPILPGVDASELSLRIPDGNEKLIPPRSVVGGVEYSVGYIDQPGVYELVNAGIVHAKYPANVKAGLGRLSRRDVAEIAADVGDARTLTVAAADLPNAIEQDRYGSELWRPIAMAFLGLLVAESILGRGRKEDNQ
jgi:hypothetical protein